MECHVAVTAAPPAARRPPPAARRRAAARRPPPAARPAIDQYAPLQNVTPFDMFAFVKVLNTDRLIGGLAKLCVRRRAHSH
ncbi:hypothetical protein EVAR_42855_1 [Eumeta japonica]|uniref:Uncharacterized protein n=1 Tax=Eumeta variegata TaxID=151549 RepID=A0A4C1WJ69_EUMVA|nr:hypothetical protein EVAR_42855_1 [Eumeta japonica]